MKWFSMTKRYFNTYKNFSKATWINILAVFIMSFGLMMSSIFTLFLNSKGVSIEMIAQIIAMGGLGGVLGSYVCGTIAKYISPTRIAQYSLLLFALNSLIFPFINNIGWFFIFYFTGNFFNGTFRPANNLMLFARTSEKEHTRVMALYRVAFNLGLAFATSIGAFLATIHFTWFFIFSSLMALSGALVLFLFNRLLTVKQKTIVKTAEKVTTPPGWQRFLRQHQFILLSILFFGFYMMFNQTRITYGLFLTDAYQLNLQHIGFLFLINFLLIVLCEVPLMTLMKNVNQVSMTMWGSVLVGLGMCILPFGHSLWVAAISVLLWSIGEILATSPFFVLAYRFAATHAKEFYIGVFHSVFSTTVVLAPLVGGILYPMHHGYVLWLGCGIITLFMAAGFLYLRQQE